MLEFAQIELPTNVRRIIYSGNKPLCVLMVILGASRWRLFCVVHPVALVMCPDVMNSWSFYLTLQQNICPKTKLSTTYKPNYQLPLLLKNFPVRTHSKTFWRVSCIHLLVRAVPLCNIYEHHVWCCKVIKACKWNVNITTLGFSLFSESFFKTFY